MKSPVLRTAMRAALAALAVVIVGFAVVLAWVSGRTGAAPWTILREEYRTETLPACIGIYTAQAQNGVRIEQVELNSPAADAQLTKGMIIRSLNGAVVTTPQQLEQRVRAEKPLDIIGLSYEQTLLGFPITTGSVGVRLGYELKGHCDNSPLAKR